MPVIAFSEEQSMLLDTAMDFCAKEAPVAGLRASIQDGLEFNGARWQAMTDLGWLGIGIPEQHGGLGMTLADAVPVAEALGRYLVPSPFVATTIAAQALMACGSPEQQSQWLPRVASGSIASLALWEPSGSWSLADTEATLTKTGDQLTLSGQKVFVEAAEEATLLVVAARFEGNVRLCLVERAQIAESAIQRESVIDETRRSFSVSFEHLVLDQAALCPGLAFDAIENASLLLSSAESSGGIAGVLGVVVDYLKTRKQFDRYIGAYQALKHPTVDILMGSEMARAYVYHAATEWAAGAEPETLENAVRMAKACATEQFAEAGDRAVQFHGGFGFTYDCDAQLYLRRALWNQYQFGDERYQRSRLADVMLAAS